jgi:hypothetical protein
MTSGCDLAPIINSVGDVARIDVEGCFDTMPVKGRDSVFNLAGSAIIEGQGNRAALTFGPPESAGFV